MALGEMSLEAIDALIIKDAIADSLRENELIVVLVGPEEKRFDIAKNLLIDNSVYFRRFFAAHPSSHMHNLEHVDAAAFAKVELWLSHSDLGSPSSCRSVSREVALASGGTKIIAELINIYAAAYDLGVTSLQDVCMELLGTTYHRSNTLPSCTHLVLAYTKAQAKSALRIYTAKAFHHKVMTSPDEPSAERLHDL